MDEQNTPNIPSQEEKKYTPRPPWQVWAARLGLVVFAAFPVVFYIRVAGGRL